MKKKLLIMLIVVLAFAACAIVFAACGSSNSGGGNNGGTTGGSTGNEPTHTHTYSDAWTSDETYHWHAATCEHTDEMSDKERHQIVIDPAVPATCESEGKTEGSHCSVCGAVIVEQDTTEKLAHEFSEWIVSTECGDDDTYSVRYCLECQYIEYDENVVVLHPHSYVYVGEKEPTCTESGYSALFRCENCGHEVMDEIEPLGHISGSVYYEDGDTHYSYCTRSGCGERVYQSHSYYSWSVVKKPTCTGYGERSAVCMYCDHVGYFPIPPQHTYDSGIVTKKPTCTGSGESLRTCVYCDATITETISALGHDYGAWEITKEPNCTETGERTQTCSRCGNDITEELPIQHTWGEWTTIKEFTCTEDGLVEHECLLCGVTQRITIYAHHIMVNREVLEEPDCTHVGKQQQSCSVCGLETVVELPALGHDMQRQTTNATCTQAGYYTDTCSRCGEVSYVGIAALGHDWVMSYDENTHHEYCTRCDDERSEDVHDFETIFRTTESGSGYTFELLESCSICAYERSLARTAVHIHNDAEILSDGRATCTEDGLLPGLVCSTCEDVLVEREGEPALGHAYINGICARCGDIQLELTLSDDGSYYILTGIGEFAGSELTIPDSYNGIEIREIGDGAFEGRTSLTKIVIPDTVTTIGERAFYDCTGLVSVTIGKGVTSIGDEAFSGCTGLTEINYNAVEVNDLAWNGDAFYNVGTSGDGITVTFGDSVKSIPDHLFYVSYSLSYRPNITSVTIGNSVTSIGSSAFSGCSGLTSIAIPDSVISIGDAAFEYCTGLMSVTIPDSVTSIGDWAFNRCTELKSVTIGSGVTNIGHTAFNSCDRLNAVYITDLAAWCAIDFYRGDSNPLSCAHYLYLNGEFVTELTIPDSVTSISGYAFYGCSGLTSVTIPDNVTSIGGYAFSGCSGLTIVTIPDNVISIGGYAFSGCSGLTSVTIPDSVTSISGAAFSGCVGLTNITIPDSVTSIGSSAFSGCSGLTSIAIPDSVISIGDAAFEYCTGLASITIPDSVTSIGQNAFYNTAYYNDETNWEDGVLYIDKHLIVANTSLSGTYTIKDGTLVIAIAAFYDCTGLMNITIPGSVTSIGSSAFSGCTGLTSVIIGNGVTSIGDGAFSGCTGLTSVTIPDSVTSIGDRAFSGCTGFTNVTIPDSVTSIGEGAFFGCSGLKSITLPFVGDTIKSSSDAYQYPFGYIFGTNSYAGSIGIGQYNGNRYDVYYIPSSLRSVTITGGNILYGAFYNCSMLTSITIPNSVTSIGDRAFSGCTGLTGIVIPNGVTSIGSFAFCDCTGLTNVTIPGSVISIGSSAFSGCTGLTSVIIGNGVTSIGDGAFSGCTGLTEINYNAAEVSDLTQYSNVFYNAGTSGNGITVIFGDSVKYIPAHLFYVSYSSYRTNIVSVIIGNEVMSIGNYAFYDCTELTSVKFENTTGWECSLYGDHISSISSSDLSSPSTAAKYLADTYASYYWQRV